MNDAHRLAPARAEPQVVDGLALTRRRRPDVSMDAPAIVLVHGAMDRSASFGRVMRRLQEFDVVAYDRRGYAGSRSTGDDTRTPPQDWTGSIADHVKDLTTVIRWLSVDSVVVVGHSLGGLIALEAALVFDIAPRITCVGAFESPAPWLDARFDQVGRGAVEIADTDGDAAGGEHFYRMMVGESTWERLRERDRTARREDGTALIDELRSLRDPSQAVDLELISVPVVIGTGGRSSPSFTADSERIASVIPNATTTVIERAGHGAHLANPDDFANYVRTCVDAGSTWRAGHGGVHV